MRTFAGLCFLYAAIRSQLPDWLRNHGGGIPYVLFWILLWLTFYPTRWALLPICVFCVFFTCCLELFQMYRGPEWLVDFRRTTFGAAWLGSGYDARDMPPYFIGGISGWLIGAALLKQSKATTDDTLSR